jgi:hypothetical protein
MLCKVAARPAALIAGAVLLLSPASALAVVITTITPQNAFATTVQGTFDVNLYNFSKAKDAKAGTDVGYSSPAAVDFGLTNIGDTSAINLFKFTVLEDVDKPEDATANPIAVNFNFSAPELGSASVTGTTSATLAPKNGNATVSLNWGSPVTVNFSGTELQIALDDLTITCNKGKKCDQLSAWVTATFTLVGLPESGVVIPEPVLAQEFVAETPVVQNPLPATLPLFASGLGAIGAFGWWRKKKAVSRS